MSRCLASLMLAAVLAGCGPQVTAPSLRLRSVEGESIDPPTETREPQLPAGMALSGQLAGLRSTAAAGHARFIAEKASTESVVANGAQAAAGSEAWTVAQQAVSALDALRGPVREAAVAIEDMRQDPANAGSGARAAIDETAQAITGWQDAEAQAVAAQAARLR